MHKTIVAIDDDKISLEIYKTALADLGQVETYETLADAMSHVARADLILLDYYLRENTGGIKDTVAGLRQHAPVLLCTGIRGDMMQHIGFESGVDGFWNKGSGLDALRDKVRELLKAA